MGSQCSGICRRKCSDSKSNASQPGNKFAPCEGNPENARMTPRIFSLFPKFTNANGTGPNISSSQYRFLTLPTLVLACLISLSTYASSEPIPIKVVVVAMFERGEVDDGNPGELELWVERESLTTALDFPLGIEDLYMNDQGVLAVLTGVGVTNATATIMALGLDPRFDFSKTYWLIAGIAGADPEDATLASAAWAEYVIDGDLVHEIDAREIPEDWPYGILPLSGTRPNERFPHNADSVVAYRLNTSLVSWAYELTRNHKIPDHPELAAFRKQFKGYPAAVEPPTVMIGDSMGSSTYWHGVALNQWANDWVKLFTNGDGNFVMTAMEDNGTVTALKRLSATGRVDYDRILVLRTGSNFSTPPPGESASWHFSAPYVLRGRPSIEAAYSVGSEVVHELIDNWEKYADSIPSGTGTED